MDGGTADRALRWTRALVLALVTLGTGGVAHRVGGGSLPAGGVLVVLVCALAVATQPLLRRPASTRRVVSLLVAGEATVHLVLSAATAAAGRRVAAGPSMHSMTAMGPHGHLSPTGGAAGSTSGVAGAVGSAWPAVGGEQLLMAEAHVAAAVLVGLWLAAGERSVWRLLSIGVGPVRAAVAGVPSSRPQVLDDLQRRPLAPDVARNQRRPRHRAADARAVTRRGPPAGPARTATV